MTGYGASVRQVGSCNVSTDLASQFRNGPHWHTVWPDGDHWCYATESEAAERVVELDRLADAPTIIDRCWKCDEPTRRTDRLCDAHHEDAEVLSARIRGAR